MDALASSVNFSPVTLLSTGTIVLERWYSSRDKGPQGALHKPSKLIEPLERRIAKGEGKPSLPYIILKEHYLLRSIVAYSNVFGGGCGRGCQGLLFPHGLLLDVEKCCVVTPNNQQLGPELKQENRGETKHQLFGGCFAWHSKVETKQETSSEFMFRFT